jgi:Peptidase_C39 like family
MRSLLLILVLLVTVAETAGTRYSLWTAFKRDALETALFTRTNLETTSALKVRLEQTAQNGSLETAPIPGHFDTAVVSWNAVTPTGSSLLIETRARFGTRWSRYYRVARWSTDPQLSRTSFTGEQDADGRLNTDTLELKRPADALQIRVTLTRGKDSPVITGLAAALSNSAQHDKLVTVPSSKTAWGTELNVPSRSQMIYPDGGEVWCSPTSVTMILEHWDAKRTTQTAERVPSAARAMWDTAYDGSGNWAFNAAYAGARGYKAYVTRLSSLSDAEAFIARGVPLVLSIAWGIGELDGVHLPKSNGHIVVLRGFTTRGDPIINDPAAKNDASVRTVYNRAQLERAWITHSGGIVYVIQP